MKKRDYLSPHTWQASPTPEINGNSKAYSRFFKKGLKPGRYVLLAVLVGLMAFLMIHRSKSDVAPAAKPASPVLQTISLPPLNPSNTRSS